MLHRMLTAGVIIAVLAASAAMAEDDSTFTVTNLTDNLYLLTTDQGAYTTNSLAFVGDDGLLLVDTQSDTEAEALKNLTDALGKGLPKYIINTHRHVEHIGGNAIYGPEPVVIAHYLVPERLHGGSYIFEEFPEATFPDITFVDSLTLRFNGETIRMFSIAGSHDDNEIAVHFVNARVAHISSITNGFNFPSTDTDGDVFMYPTCVEKAMRLLPEDVRLVSGHNAVGSYSDLEPYRQMLVKSTEIVKAGLDAGKDLATMQKEKVLAEFEHYAGSYVSTDDWIDYLVTGFQKVGAPRKDKPYVPLYHAWKQGGGEAAIAKYHELKRDQGDVYDFTEVIPLVIGDRLLGKSDYGGAIAFFDLSLQEYPEGTYRYYIYFERASAKKELGQIDGAIADCEKSVALNADFGAAAGLLEELKKL